MRVIIFDLDLTLASTEPCHAYLRTKLGRQTVVSALQSREVSVSFYGRPLVALVNSLQLASDHCVAVVSDSPKDYCLQVLTQGGYQVNGNLVFGGVSKPLVDQEAISNAVSEELGVEAEDLEFLVVGDSPKDIYYAHSIESPSVFVSWGSRHTANAGYSQPTKWADNVQELTLHIKSFLDGKLKFKRYDFKQDYITVDPAADDFVRVTLSEEQIGFGKEYVKSWKDHRNDDDRWASTDLHQVVKQAKNLSVADHDVRRGTPLYGSKGLYSAQPFKTKAWFFKNDFLKWCVANKVKGNVLLVPVPPSVPRECNLSHSMSLMCRWWKGWIIAENPRMNVKVHDIFERFLPKIPSHLSLGWRDMDEQFETLGVFQEDKGKEKGADFVVIVDDVVTSGSHMNAIASFIRTKALVDESTLIFGYALFKTTRVEAADDDDLSWLDEL